MYSRPGWLLAQRAAASPSPTSYTPPGGLVPVMLSSPSNARSLLLGLAPPRPVLLPVGDSPPSSRPSSPARPDRPSCKAARHHQQQQHGESAGSSATKPARLHQLFGTGIASYDTAAHSCLPCPTHCLAPVNLRHTALRSATLHPAHLPHLRDVTVHTCHCRPNPAPRPATHAHARTQARQAGSRRSA
jgi:hypothetical protein